jgi:hypothetical protein
MMMTTLMMTTRMKMAMMMTALLTELWIGLAATLRLQTKRHIWQLSSGKIGALGKCLALATLPSEEHGGFCYYLFRLDVPFITSTKYYLCMGFRTKTSHPHSQVSGEKVGR